MAADEYGYDPDKTYTKPDNEFWDCTDAAHPAWWRGEEFGSKAIMRRWAEVLDGKIGTGKHNEPLQSLCERTARIAALESELKEQAMLVGKGSEREAALLAKVAELTRALSLAKPCVDHAARRVEQGGARAAAPILTAKAMIDRLLSPDYQQSINPYQIDREGKG